MIQSKTAFLKTKPAISPFLGIGEGKQKAAKAAAAAQAAASEQQAALADAMMQLAGANVAKQKADAEATLISAKSAAEASASAGKVAEIGADSGTNLYLIIGGIVAVLMVGLYFIIKARKK